MNNIIYCLNCIYYYPENISLLKEGGRDCESGIEIRKSSIKMSAFSEVLRNTRVLIGEPGFDNPFYPFLSLSPRSPPHRAIPFLSSVAASAKNKAGCRRSTLCFFNCVNK